jgi:hypothetical protein
MPNILFTLLAQDVSAILGLILAVSSVIAGLAMWLQEGALKEEGPDRDRLIRSLRLGGDLRRHYVFWVTRALNRVDRFLGDADKADCSLPSPFGNRQAKPYWTGWSFDVCALIALVYPIMSMIATWLWTADGGELGAVLGLPTGAALRDRVISAVLIVWIVFAVWKLVRSDGWQRAVWFVAAGADAVVATTTTTTTAYVFTFAGAFAFAAAVSGAISGAISGAVAVAVAVAFSFDVTFSVAVHGPFIITCANAVGVIGIGVAWLAERAARRRRMGFFWLLAWPAIFAAIYVGLWADTAASEPQDLKLLLVMFGLVPLLNVPLDWASIGFTRALLRRGCERGAPSPLLLGLLDFAVGLVLLAILGAFMVVALHAADSLIVRAGGVVLIDVPMRLYRIVAAPAGPGNWWIYLTVFSTLIPSAMNLAIGMFSLVTVSFPKHRERLIAKILGLRGVGFDRTRRKILLELGAQAFLGAFAAGIAIWGIVWLLLMLAPWFLFGLEYLAVYVEWLLPT